MAAVVLGVGASAWLAVWPCFYTGTAAGTNGSGIQPRRVCNTLIGENGLWVIWLLLIPVALSLIALLASWTGNRVGVWVCGGAAIAFCVVGAFSIGIFYLPSAIAIVSAAAMMRRLPHQQRLPG